MRTAGLIGLLTAVALNAQAQGRGPLSTGVVQTPVAMLSKTLLPGRTQSSGRGEKKVVVDTLSPELVSAQLMSSLAQAQGPRKGWSSKKAAHLDGEQIQALEKLQKRIQVSGEAKVAFSKANGTPSLMAAKRLNGRFSDAVQYKKDALSEARQFFSENRALMKIDAPADEFHLLHQAKGHGGRKHLRFQQLVNGVPYWGKSVAVHLNKDSDIYFFQGRYEPTLKNFDVVPELSAAEAKEKVRQDFSNGLPLTLDAELMVYSDDQTTPLLTYKIDVARGMDQRWIYFVDAASGAIVHRVNNIHYAGELVNASGRDLQGNTQNFNAWFEAGKYYVIDPSFSVVEQHYNPLAVSNPFGDTIIFDARNGDGSSLDYSVSNQLNSGWDAAAVSAIDNVYTVYNYFKDSFDRDGIDGKNLNNLVAIHFESDYNNAFWNGAYMVYGDGDGQVFSSLVGCLDVAAHEMTHGVIENTANLIYQNQSGALNESYADIFGVMVDRDDWTVGEDCTVATPGYLRSLADPSKGLSPQPGHMDDYQNLPASEAGDYGGVHVNSGIPNRAAYLMAEGLSSEGLGTSIGRAKTEQIFYAALTTYLVASSQFIDARRATIQAAEDLYGAGSVEVTGVIAAWDAVGVTEGGTIPGQTSPTNADAVLGDDVLLYLYPGDGVADTPRTETFALYLQGVPSPFNGYDAAQDVQVMPQPLSASYTRPAIVTTTTGSYVYFVGVDKNIYMIDLSSNTYTQLTTSADIWSLAVSPAGDYMVYTGTSLADDNIYVVNLDNGETKAHKIVPVSYQEGEFSAVDSVHYADSLSFNFSGTKIVFDALFCQSVVDSDCNSGGGYKYWSIGFLDITDGGFSYPFPSQNPLFDIGYPAFAYNNDYVITMDMHDYSDALTSGNVYSDVMSLNTETQALELVVPIAVDGVGHWGVPSFWGDDDFVVVQMPTTVGLSTYRVPIKTDWSGDYAKTERLNNFAAAMPRMHRAGTRNLSTELQVNAALLDFGEVPAGSEKHLSLQITNVGNVDVDITNIVMSNAMFADNAVNTTLPRGASVSVDVSFLAGENTGTQAGTLTFYYGTGSELAVSLTGTVVLETAAEIQSTPASLAFGQIEEGSEKRLSLTISNGSNDAMQISAVTISNSLFSHDLVESTIPAGTSIAVNVSFSAAATGDQSGVMTIQYGAGKAISISLSASTIEKSSGKSGGGAASFLLLLLYLRWLVSRRL